VSIDGYVWDVPDSAANAAEFGYGAGARQAAYPKVRVVTLTESGSRAPIGAALGPSTGKGTGEQSLAAGLFTRLQRLIHSRHSAIAALICRRICREGRRWRRAGCRSRTTLVVMGVGRCLAARVSVLDAWSMLIRAGWLPQDGLFGGGGCAGLEIERGGVCRCS
jgi:hypothetical protein